MVLEEMYARDKTHKYGQVTRRAKENACKGTIFHQTSQMAMSVCPAQGSSKRLSHVAPNAMVHSPMHYALFTYRPS